MVFVVGRRTKVYDDILVEVATISIRPAYITDATPVVALLQQVLLDAGQILTGATHEPDVLAVLAQFFRSEDNRLSYRNTLIAEEEQQIVGVIVTYYGLDAARLDRPIIEHLRCITNDPSISLDKEADEDEFYIDVLSVSSQYAGRGIGTALMLAAEQLARHRQYKKMGLNVEEENVRAYRLYNRLGYQKDKIIYLYSNPYHHLVKHLL